MVMLITPKFSDSHKADVTWKLKVDKLTLLHELPQQWKEGMTSTMIDLVSNPSNQSAYGISRSYSPGCRGYEVSIDGKVPTSTDPLIWSKDSGYLLQVEPKKKGAGKKPWLRLDINPLALTPTGMAHLVQMLGTIFQVPWPTWRYTCVSRIDAALDVYSIALNDWVWDMPNRRSRELVCRERAVRTLYLGAKKSNSLVIYDKAKQDPALAAGKQLTRVEFRAQNPGLVADLPGLPNPFVKAIVFDPGQVASQPECMRRSLRAVGQLGGMHAILEQFPPAMCASVKASMLKASAPWWDPHTFWAEWSECLSDTLPSVFASEYEASAAAYIQAMQAEGNSG